MGFKWFIYNCPNVNYLLKTDDDVFINTPELYRNLEDLLNFNQQLQPGNGIFCSEVLKPRAQRSNDSKWRVDFETYGEEFYPNYCSGFSVLFTADVVFRLYDLAQKLQYFWIDDVQISGIVRSKLNIPITSGKKLFLSEKETRKLLTNSEVSRSFKFLFAAPDLTESEIRKLWKIVS